MNKNVVVISAHPDDEILGLGGTLVRHRDAGDKLSWIIATNISTSQGFSSERVRTRQKEIVAVSEQLGMETFKLDFPTMSLEPANLNQLIPAISDIFKQVQPSRVYVLNRSDAHSDHRILFDAVMACTKSFRYPYIREVWMYECLSETEFAPALPEKAFIPNCYVDITNQMEEKVKLMRIYESELGDHPFPRSERNIKALATFRGATTGVEYAEAFQILKSIHIEAL